MAAPAPKGDRRRAKNALYNVTRTITKKRGSITAQVRWCTTEHGPVSTESAVRIDTGPQPEIGATPGLPFQGADLG